MEDVLSKRRQRARSHLPWLYRELQQLQQDGMVDTATAQRVKNLYGDAAPGGSKSKHLLLVGLAVLGGLLTVGGVIMLTSTWWDDLPHRVKLFLAVLPLLCGLAFGGWVLVRAKSRGWTESAAAVLALTPAAAMALVAQTYHLSGDLPQFLLLWAVLTLPLLYLFRSTAAAMLYLLLLVSWCGAACGRQLPVWPFWLLLGAYVPYWLQEKKRTGNSAGIVWQNWGMAAGCFFVPGFICAQAFAPFDWRTGYLLAFTMLYLWSVMGNEQDEPFRRRPFANLGLLGLGTVAFCLCFKQNWLLKTADGVTVSRYVNIALRAFGPGCCPPDRSSNGCRT